MSHNKLSVLEKAAKLEGFFYQLLINDPFSLDHDPLPPIQAILDQY